MAEEHDVAQKLPAGKYSNAPPAVAINGAGQPIATALLAQADTDAALDFLSVIAPTGRLALAAIVPDGRPEGRTFEMPQDRERLRSWIDAGQSVANLYYTLNEPVSAALQTGKSGRVCEADILAIRGVAIDVDPDRIEETKPGGFQRERARLLELAGRIGESIFGSPTAVVDSGGGFQVLWLFSEPLPNTPRNGRRAREQAAAIGRRYGSDSVHSLEHLFRIPGTVNLPNRKKQDRGRVATVARVLSLTPRERWSLDSLASLVPPIAQAPAAGVMADCTEAHNVLGDPGALPSDLKAMIECARDELPGFARMLDKEERPDRSNDDNAIACFCVEAGFSDEETALTLAAYSPEKFEERGDSYLSRTIAKARATTSPRMKPDDAFQPIMDGSRPDFSIVTGPIDATTIPVREWLIRPRLPLRDVTQCVGEPGISKSTFALRDALIVATGDERILRGAGGICGERLHRSGPVIVYNAEDRLGEMRRRLAAAMTHYAITQLRHPIRLWSGVDHESLKIMARTVERSALKLAPGAESLERAIRALGAVLVILDPQVGLAAGSVENSNDDADALMQELARMASRTGAAFVVVHHTAKATRDHRGDIGAGRGGSAYVAKVRSAHTLCNVTGEGEEKAWGVSATDGLIRLDYSKTSHDRLSREPIVFRRISATVGNGNGAPEKVVAAMFDASPEDALRAAGDHAPVLELVDVKAMAAQKSAAGRVTNSAEAEKIASIAVAIMGDQTEMAFAGPLQDAMGERMREDGISRAVNRNTVRGHIVSALAGDGVTFSHDGTSIRVWAAKKNAGVRSPFFIFRAASTEETA